MWNSILFAENFKPHRNISYPITKGTSNNRLKNDAFVAYEKENYLKSAQLFDNLYAVDKQSYYLFYQGNALLAIEKVDEAIKVFEKHIKNGGDLVEKTPWFLALAYIKKEDHKNAKKYLETLINEKGYKYNEAKRLLSKLE